MELRNFKLASLLIIISFFFVPKITLAADWSNIGFAGNNIKNTFADPGNNQHIIVSLTTQLDGAYNYFTDNGGANWQPLNMSGASACNNFAQNPKSKTEYWAGCNNGLFHSMDGGKTFSKSQTVNFSTNIRVTITADGVIFVTHTANEVWKSIDGIIWELQRVPDPGYTTIFANKYNAQEVYVSKSGNVAPGLYKTTNGGSTWTLLNNQVPIRSGVNQMTFAQDGKICASVGTSGIACSVDGGYTWSEFASPNPSAPHESQHFYQLAQNPDDDANLLVLAGTWTGTDMKLYNYKDGATVPEIIPLANSSSSLSVSQGVIYTWAEGVTWTKGLWKNEGIAVVPEYLKKHPVIIVPGILGSWFVPSKGRWELDPVLGTYDSLYNSFVDAGYEPGKSLFTFAYQWRNDNRYTAELLAAKIKEVKQASGANKVDIVAHSMGGLVSRFYAEGDYYDNDINNIFFLGTPQLGSSKMYPIWAAGYIGYEDIYAGALMSFLLVEESITNKYFGVNGVKDYVRNQVPSMGQLLPTFNYLQTGSVPATQPSNEALTILNNNKQKLIDRGIRVINLIGDNGPITMSQLTVEQSNSLPFWDYGAPIGLGQNDIYRGITYAHGDGTVTVESQSYISGKNYVLSGVKHTELPNNSARSIFQELGLNATPRITEKINNLLMIKAYSPVDFYVLAPDGKKIGYNKDGSDFNEILGAFYTGIATETEFLTIPNPLPGEYKVVAYGTGSGSYEIEATYADDEANTTLSSSYTGKAELGKEDKLVVELTPESNTIKTSIEDKTAPVTTVSLQGNIIGDYYNTDVQLNLAAVDTESGVAKTEYSLDGVVWQDYTAPIVLTQEGEAAVAYRSVDKAGNVEVPQNVLVRIDKTPPITTVNINKSVFTRWDNLSLFCKATDSYSGVKEFAVSLDGVTLDCSKPHSLFDKALGGHVINYKAIDQADNTSGAKIDFKIIANYSSTARDISWLFEKQNFKSRGDAVSLLVQVELSAIFDLLRMKKQSANALQQALDLSSKLLSKGKITNVGYDMITKDIKYIMEGK